MCEWKESREFHGNFPVLSLDGRQLKDIPPIHGEQSFSSIPTNNHRAVGKQY